MVTKQKEKTYAEFAERLKEACRDKGFDSEERGFPRKLGAMAGIGYKGAEKWLHGLTMPDIPNGSALAKSLGVGFEWLMTGRGPKRLSDVIKATSDKGESPAMPYDTSEASRRLAQLLDIWPALGEEKQSALVKDANDFARMTNPEKYKKTPTWKNAPPRGKSSRAKQ